MGGEVKGKEAGGVGSQ